MIEKQRNLSYWKNLTKNRSASRRVQKYFLETSGIFRFSMSRKEKGISILVSMGTSLLVLALAFATLDSIARSLDQASNIQRTTQLFFASESGIEASFFHHNSRGAGLDFSSGDASQTIVHPVVDATTSWSLQGRTTTSNGNNAALAEMLKENQTIQIQLQWDSSGNPTIAPNNSGGPNFISDDLIVNFYNDTDQIPNSTAKNALLAEYGASEITSGFDFGSANTEVLIDWSLSRKSTTRGVETFVPTDNSDCSGATGFICEDQLMAGTQTISTNNTTPGKILPGTNVTDLNAFWSCTDSGGGTCSDFRLTFRSLLKFEDTGTATKIPGIPFMVEYSGSGTVKPFPKSYYTVNSDVSLAEQFSQQISIDIPEKTSIGAFDYVVFD